MIFERKGNWYVEGRGRPYASRKDAEAAAGVSAGVSIPLPEVKEYASIEEAVEDIDKEDAL